MGVSVLTHELHLLVTISQFTTSPLIHTPDICTVNISDCIDRHVVDVDGYFHQPEPYCKSDSCCVLNHGFSP